MQKTLSFFSARFGDGQNIQDVSRPGSVSLDASEQKEGDAELFQSFLAYWNKAAEGNANGAALLSSLDLKFSAEGKGVHKEENLSLSSDFEANLSSLSASLLSFVASFSGELQEEGMDASSLAEKAQEVLGDVLSDMDLNRLKATLSKLRERYPSTIQSNNENHYGINVRTPDGLALALEASFATSEQAVEDPALVPKEAAEPASEQDEDVPEAETADPAMNAVALSRMYAYLAPSASGPETSAKAESLSRPASLSASEKKAPQPGMQAEAPAVASEPQKAAPVDSARQEGPRTAEDEARAHLQQKEAAKPSNEASTPVADKSASEKTNTLPAKEEERPLTAKAASHDRDFESFFQSIATRRNQMDAKAAPLELSKESPLSQNSTLRESMDNVVRFIRADGAQKAMLIVDPPALGRISVELTNSTSGIEASIKVSSEQVRQMIQDQIVQLRMSLSQQGVQLTQFSVDVHQDNSGQHQGFQQQQQARRGIPGGDVPDEAQDEQTTFRVDLNQGLLHWVA